MELPIQDTQKEEGHIKYQKRTTSLQRTKAGSQCMIIMVWRLKGGVMFSLFRCDWDSRSSSWQIKQSFGVFFFGYQLFFK